MYHVFVKKVLQFTFILKVCIAVSFYSMPYGNKPDVFGNTFNFKSLQGNVALVVNIPFDCKLTDPIYDDLRYVHNELNKKGAFIILFFMSEQFLTLTPNVTRNKLENRKRRYQDYLSKSLKRKKLPDRTHIHCSNSW